MKNLTSENALNFIKENISDPVLVKHTQRRQNLRKVTVRAVTEKDREICKKLTYETPSVTLRKFILEGATGVYYFSIKYEEGRK
jgi:hypothetical protein